MVEREREEGEEEGEIPGCAPMVVAMGEIERKNAALGEIGCTVASEEVVVPSPIELHWWNSAAIVQDPFGALSSWNHSLHYCHWNDILCSHCQHPDRVIGITLMSQGLVGLLSPHVPSGLYKISSIIALSVAINHLEGNIPHDIGSTLPNLKGSLPDSIANLFTYLSWIDLRFNQIHGSIPSGIGNLLNLTQLSMAVNNLVGPIPSSIDRLHKLCTLFLEQNKFTELPSSIGNLTSLITLNLGENDIHGSIPPSLGNCHNLLELHLYNNNLNGSIPPEIMSLSSISKFRWLGHNALTGSLPSEVGYLKNFANMNVSYNKLSGPIPNTLSNCFSLEWLHLEANSFEGEIPQSLKLMRGLRVLDLSHNNLSGLIPSYLG
ncbi:putative receptor-like protein kinase At3g47110 [Camellia sinensis]|uniref:putative receptor-like protein kinase At3g47110 n=1 Tax=Camellia sinensis TaxID=4442 RepID=UPI0010356856|nr:putative receptor-like protein kinase At3g47110 [Camellia sinensis]